MLDEFRVAMGYRSMLNASARDKGVGGAAAEQSRDGSTNPIPLKTDSLDVQTLGLPRLTWFAFGNFGRRGLRAQVEPTDTGRVDPRLWGKRDRGAALN